MGPAITHFETRQQTSRSIYAFAMDGFQPNDNGTALQPPYEFIAGEGKGVRPWIRHLPYTLVETRSRRWCYAATWVNHKRNVRRLRVTGAAPGLIASDRMLVWENECRRRSQGATLVETQVRTCLAGEDARGLDHYRDGSNG